jgi:diamine N-acetyltransferase
MKVENFSLRRAELADAKLACDIARRNFSETWSSSYAPHDLAEFLAHKYSLEQHQRWLADRDNFAIYLSFAGEQCIGHTLLGPCELPHVQANPADGEIMRMYLLRAFHGSGLGSQMMQQAIAWLTRKGPRTLWLGVWSENFGAQRLYQRFGFSHAGEYEFVVGATRDHEFIYRRPPE